MKWPRPHLSTKNDAAAQRLAELEQRQERVSEVAEKFRRENGFIRMVRESMGPIR